MPQVKKTLPILTITTYWGWNLFKFLKFTDRTPKNLDEVLFYSCLEAIIALGVVSLLLKISYQEKLSRYFLEEPYKKLLKKGLLWGIISFVIINFVFSPIGQILTQVFHLPEIKFPQSDTSFFFKTAFAPFYWILISIIGGGVAEETIRYFSLSFFERELGKSGLIIAIMISSLFFGLGHIYQGSSWAIAHFFSGLLWSYVYWRNKNLIVNIVTHGFFDLIGSLIACILYG